MDGYLPSRYNAHCACCVHRPTVERTRGVFLVPTAVLLHEGEDDDYEAEPLYYYHHKGLPARRRRWLRRMEEEEAFEAPPPHFAPCENRVDPCINCVSNKAEKGKEKGKGKGQQQEFLHTLAQRLETLEMGMKELTRVRNSPQLRRGHVVRSNPAANDFAAFRAESFHSAEEKRCGRKAMDPEEAAAVIQSRFRAYLVRRSQSLRNLGYLAMVKSSFKELKCLIADARYRKLVSRDANERNSFSQRVAALLFKVDSVQGSDRMVAEARRSLSKELVTLLDSIDHMGAYTSPADNKKSAGRRRTVQYTEDMMVNDRVRMSNNCFHCTGEMPKAHSYTFQEELMTEEEQEEEEEEVIEEPHDWRGRLSLRGYFTSATLQPVLNNRHKHSHGPKQCRLNEFDMSRYTNRKMCRNDRKKFCFPGHVVKGEMGAMEEMTDIGSGCYAFHF
ncbi:hypothetical protein KI387_003869 [Taxus chinensis]|uniref:Uncharacterized protein n=1 Tax=Taxus chinensis TaxID=29808 RepID=A0AA38LPM2_TAXCH|nr:hypothetical protein KI387_003869 [Taxus chinensis]